MVKSVRIGAVLAAMTFFVGCSDAESPTNFASDDSSLSELGEQNPTTTNDGSCTTALTGTYDDDIIVPVGGICTLQGATVDGNVKALEGAELYVIDSRVTGNIEGDEARIVHVLGGTVEGNIQIKDGTSSRAMGAMVVGTTVTEGNIQIEKMRTGEILVDGAAVLKGDLQVVENHTSIRLHLLNSPVAGNLQVSKNQGAGDKLVQQNEVSQALQCKENTSPFTGGPNAAGETEGQCF